MRCADRPDTRTAARAGHPGALAFLFLFFFADTTHPNKEGRDAPERRCSSRTFRYGYLVTT